MRSARVARPNLPAARRPLAPPRPAPPTARRTSRPLLVVPSPRLDPLRSLLVAPPARCSSSPSPASTRFARCSSHLPPAARRPLAPPAAGPLAPLWLVVPSPSLNPLRSPLVPPPARRSYPGPAPSAARPASRLPLVLSHRSARCSSSPRPASTRSACRSSRLPPTARILVPLR